MSHAEIFTSMPDDQLGRLALIEAVRANTDAVQRMARQGENYGAKLDDINKGLHGLDRRLALIENNTIERDLERVRNCTNDLDTRVVSLETERDKRKGAMGLVEWITKNWAGIFGLILLLFLIAKTQVPEEKRNESQTRSLPNVAEQPGGIAAPPR